MKILFASQAIDGHFNPMTGVAVRLKERGHDLAWYTGPVFRDKLRDLDIPLLPFQRTVEHRVDNLFELYPERAKPKGPRAIGFDGEKIFASNVSNFFEDIRELEQDFAFDVAVVDSSMFIHSPVTSLMGKPMVNFVAIPNMESDPQARTADGRTIPVLSSSIQTGPEALDFPRRHKNPSVHYVGALLPYRHPGLACG